MIWIEKKGAVNRRNRRIAHCKSLAKKKTGVVVYRTAAQSRTTLVVAEADDRLDGGVVDGTIRRLVHVPRLVWRTHSQDRVEDTFTRIG